MGPDASKGITVFVLIVVILYFGKEVLVPVTLALLLAFIIAPLVNLLRRLHLGRVPSVLLAVFLALGIVLAVGGVIGTQLADLATGLPQYAQTLETKVAKARAYTVGRISNLADQVGVHAGPNAGNGASKNSATTPNNRTVSDTSVIPTAGGPLELAQTYLAPILAPFATFGIVFIVAVFALLQREDLRDRLIRLFGSNDLHRTTVAIDDAGRRLSRYFLTQLSINTAFGVVIGIGLMVIGVPNPVLWAILSALLRFVPYVGSIISAILPMALAAAVEPGWSILLWTAGLYVVVEFLTGQAIEPLVYGHSTGLSPFSVVVAALFWSWVWGPIGLILSTPLTLCLVVLGRHVKKLEFLDVMLGDQPALTPVESFYQRLLAGDADETQDHAEALLKDVSLSTYYDEVALKGLQLAANDLKRGVLNEDQLALIKGTVTSLVAGLSGYEDREPPAHTEEAAASPTEIEHALHRNPTPLSVTKEDGIASRWRLPGSILCIAGRGPLDEAAATILVHLLEKHGLNGRVVTYHDVSRHGIEHLDVGQVAMVCVSYLDISGAPAHLRYLMRRLRQRLPENAPILVGLWPAEDSTLKSQETQTSIGANFFTSSLAAAVDACVKEAEKPQAV